MLTACGGGESTGSGTGTLSLSLSDATTEEYNAVYVTIDEVQVHKEGDEDGSWHLAVSPKETYNLLDLVNGVREELGIAELETGHHTQMRLILGDTPDTGINLLSQGHPYANYIIDTSNTYHELKIPSGLQTGIKIVHGFDINENQTTELILDFDASKAIVMAGSSGKWLLKPTIQVLDTAEYSIISGTVTANDAEGVLVSAQIYDPSADDVKDRVVIQASTITDEGGSYTIFLQPGTYNLVAYKDGYTPECERIVAASSSSYTQDFTLNTASTGGIPGAVNIADGDDEQYMTLSFRQGALCGRSSGEEQIELTSLNVGNGGDYSMSLPEGEYSVVASTDDKETQVYSIEVTAGTDTRLDI
jgi:hypothetical protein